MCGYKQSKLILKFSEVHRWVEDQLLMFSDDAKAVLKALTPNDFVGLASIFGYYTFKTFKKRSVL